MQKVLFLFTDFFPFEPFEPYLENEIAFLYKNFERIYIYSQSDVKSDHADVPEHVSIYNNKVQISTSSKLKALFTLNFGLFRQEKKFTKQNQQQGFSLKKQKVFVMELWKAKAFMQPISKTIKKELSQKNAVYVYSYWWDYKAMAAALLKKTYPQIKAITRAHGWDVYSERNADNYLPFKKFMSDCLDSIFFVSENGMKYMEKKLGAHNNYAVARLGTYNSNPLKNIKKTSPFSLISCARLVPLKRVELLIEALTLLNSNYEVKWTHFGDGPEYEKLKEHASNLFAAKPNIQFEMPGFIENEAILERYKNENYYLFVNTSSTEGLPMTMMEAMSFGIPVVGTDVGGVSEIINNNSNGILLKSNPLPLEIAEAIEKFILMDDIGYGKFRNEAFKKWDENFNAKKLYPVFINALISK